MDIPQIADRNRATPAGWSRSGGRPGRKATGRRTSDSAAAGEARTL